MRVTFEHKEAKKLFGLKTEYTLVFTVRLTEREKFIIKERNLGKKPTHLLGDFIKSPRIGMRAVTLNDVIKHQTFSINCASPQHLHLTQDSIHETLAELSRVIKANAKLGKKKTITL